jgi:NADPH-dependent ferric siderophore reductase
MLKPKKPSPCILTVKNAFYLTPHMIRVVLTSPELESRPVGCEGANCKIFLPSEGQSPEELLDQIENGPRPTVRTYTVRNFRKDFLELDIDFVAHGDEGPASAFAMSAKEGDFLAFRGPSEVKISEYYADWYLLAADMSALPVASATLEVMPRDAKGLAIFEVQTEDDIQDIAAPEGVDIRWLIQSDPHVASRAQEAVIRATELPAGVIQTCIAGESGVIKSLRGFLTNETEIAKKDIYISGYWKIGLIEDEHQAQKRLEA